MITWENLKIKRIPSMTQIHDIYSKIHFVNAEKGAVKTMNVRKANANAAKGGASTGETISLDRIRERVQRMKTHVAFGGQLVKTETMLNF
jgi:hypothetical protein